jgi:transcriptional regulator of acetoin/glycerol metabolism
MQAIRQALTNANGNVSAAARELGISRQTLYRKLQEN